MRSLRFPLVGLMGLVLFCGLGLAALKNPTHWTASIVVTSTATVLLFSILASIRGRHRTFWLGFAVVGWGYGLLAIGPGSDRTTRACLLTDRVLYLAAPLFFPNSARLREVWVVGEYGHGPSPPLDPLLQRFVYLPNSYFQVGHSLATLIHGMAGGIVLLLLAASESKSKEEPRSPDRESPTETASPARRS